MKTFENETKIVKMLRDVYTKHFEKIFTRHLWQVFLWIHVFFLFKANCSIDVSPEFRQDKTKKSIFSIYVVVAVVVK